MSAFSSIYIPFLVKSVLCVFLECFKCEITDILRCLGILNGIVEHSKSTEIQTDFFQGSAPNSAKGLRISYGTQFYFSLARLVKPHRFYFLKLGNLV